MSRNRFFSNPFSNEERYQSAGSMSAANEGYMTKEGALNKTFILTGILIATSVFSFIMGSVALMIIGAIGALVCSLVAAFKPTSSAITAPLYAAFEGLFLGSITLAYGAIAGGGESIAYGVIGIAILATLGVLVSMLLLYRTGIIQPTEKLRAVVFTGIATIAFIYLVSMILSLTGIGAIPYLHTAHPIGIIVSLIIIGFASLSLIFDFEIYDKGPEMNAPKYMEWFAGMSLLVTLVWIYIEILRLAAVIAASSRD